MWTFQWIIPCQFNNFFMICNLTIGILTRSIKLALPPKQNVILNAPIFHRFAPKYDILTLIQKSHVHKWMEVLNFFVLGCKTPYLVAKRCKMGVALPFTYPCIFFFFCIRMQNVVLGCNTAHEINWAWRVKKSPDYVSPSLILLPPLKC